MEFANDAIEQLQEKVARELGFVISRHKMEIYGICSACRTGRAARKSAAGAH